MKLSILFASVVVQLCLGGLYAWTTFVPPLRSVYGLTTAQTQIIFGALIAVFTITMVFAGKALESKGPGFLLIIAGVLFPVGYVIASFSGGNFWVLFLGISVVAGVATGLGYVCPLSTCMRWFPRHQGLVAGIAVAGFGGGAIILANLAEWRIERGTDVLIIFRWIGIIYGIIIVSAGTYMRFPTQKHGQSVSAPFLMRTLGKDPFFFALICAMFCGTFSGLLVIGNLMPIALDSGITPSHAAVGISAFAMGNVAGRILWGRLVDKIGAKSVAMSLAHFGPAIACLFLITSNASFFALVAFWIGFGFGANFVIHAALVASRYGTIGMGRIYPLVFLSYGAAGITGPVIGGWLYDLSNSYFFSISVSVAVVIIGLFASGTLLRKTTRKNT